MSDATVLAAVDATHAFAAGRNIEVSPSDVGALLGFFLRTLARAEPATTVDGWLEALADECEKAADE